MSVQLFLRPDGTWQAECPHCGGPITSADTQADLEAVLAAMGVPPLPGLDDEGAA